MASLIVGDQPMLAISSISTAMPAGNEIMPTALRADEPGIAERVEHQCGEAVDHLRMLGEVGRGVHHAEDLHDARDPIEGTEVRATSRASPTR